MPTDYATGKKKIPIADYEKSFPDKPHDTGLTEAIAPEGYAYYLDPNTGKYQLGADVSIYQQEKGLLGEAQAGVEGQVKAAEAAIGTAQKAGDAALQKARRTAAMQLSSYRGMGEGGRGMALGRGAAAEAGTTEAGILAKTAQAVSEEQQNLADAKTQAAIAQKKLLEQQKTWSQEAVSAEADAVGVVNDLKGTVYTTTADRQKMIDQLTIKMNAAVSPQAKAAYMKMISNLRSSSYDIPGTIDVD